MYCFALPLFLLSFAFAADLSPSELGFAPADKGLPKPNVTSSSGLEDITNYCFFGEVPSASCRFNCYMKKQSAFCNKEGICQCREDEEEEKQRPQINIRPTTIQPGVLNSTEEEEEETSPHLMFYILDLSPMFSEDNITEKPLPSTAKSWTSPYVLAALVLVVLTVLVLLEIVVCCKRRQTKFINVRPVLTPPACEKAPIG